MAWLQLSIDIPAHRTDRVCEALESIGALSITLLDGADQPLLEPAPGEIHLWTSIRLVALFPAGQDEQTLRGTLHMQLPELAADAIVGTLADQDWSNTWRDSFSAMRFGEHLWVCPVGEMPQQSDAVVVHLDPGMAFGTGTHATTAMCLCWLDAHPPVGQRVIDYGCGSGILAIAAHKLSAAHVSGIDIDSQALLATQENARRNGCDAAIKAVYPDQMDAGTADLLIANILANPLIELAEDFSHRVRPGGQVVLTGILSEQAGSVQAAYQPVFDFAPPVTNEEWVLLAGTRR